MNSINVSADLSSMSVEQLFCEYQTRDETLDEVEKAVGKNPFSTLAQEVFYEPLDASIREIAYRLKRRLVEKIFGKEFSEEFFPAVADFVLVGGEESGLSVKSSEANFLEVVPYGRSWDVLIKTDSEIGYAEFQDFLFDCAHLGDKAASEIAGNMIRIRISVDRLVGLLAGNYGAIEIPDLENVRARIFQAAFAN